jgi:hypothetical protein
VSMERMNREQFYNASGSFSRQQLQQALWTLYWRTTATRERIEAELAPPGW